MVAWALMPRRHRREQLTAVLSWALIWVDNAFTGHWTDWLGTATLFMAFGAIFFGRRHISHPERSD
nr:hypothetical protein [Kibdelosporangium sp. MJ126-NF4]